MRGRERAEARANRADRSAGGQTLDVSRRGTALRAMARDCPWTWPYETWPQWLFGAWLVSQMCDEESTGGRGRPCVWDASAGACSSSRLERTSGVGRCPAVPYRPTT